MFLEFKGRIPNIFVLKRLESIGKELDSSQGVVFSRTELKRLIKDILNPEKRTLEDYFKCFTNFSKQNGKPITEMFEISYNMKGFYETVLRYIEENSLKYAK